MSETCDRMIETPAGVFYLRAHAQGLREVCFDKPPTLDEHGRESKAIRILDRAQQQIAEYFEGQRQSFDVVLDPRGTPFQRRVWRALLEIPYGTVCSYGEIARRIEHPTAVRAVGAANGANPLPILVPCHRVIGQNGRLTGYAGGLDRKRALLEHEGLCCRDGRVTGRRQPSLDWSLD